MTIYLNKKCGLLLMFCCRIAKHRQGSTISESHEARRVDLQCDAPYRDPRKNFFTNYPPIRVCEFD